MNEHLKRLGEELLQSVKGYVARSLEGFSQRLKALEDRPPQPGPAGEPGQPGVQGEPGRAGDKGEKGDPGERGADGLNGKDVDLSAWATMVKEVVGALPAGKEVVLPPPLDQEAVARQVFDLTLRHLAAVPLPKDGQDGAAGRDGIDGAAGAKGEPGERGQKGEPGLAGKDGANGVDGKDGTNGLDGKDGAAGPEGQKGDPGLAGKDGANGVDGKSIDPATVLAEIERLVSLLPKAIDGADGRDGRDGDNGRDANAVTVLPGIDPAKKYQRGTYAAFRGGEVYAFRATDPIGSEADPEGKACDLERCGWQVNRNGEAEFDVVLGEDLRTLTVRRTDTRGQTLERSVRIPTTIHRGVWKEGEHTRGDQVTWDGSQWTCRVERTRSKPAADNTDWQLSTKRGRDGRDGLKGEKGERGAEGRAGMDRPAPMVAP